MEKVWRVRTGRDHCGASRGDGELSWESNMIRAKLTLTSMGALGMWMGQQKDSRGCIFNMENKPQLEFLGRWGGGDKELHHYSRLSRGMNKLESFSVINLIAFYKLLLFYMHECFGYMHVCLPPVCLVPSEPRRWYQNPWTWSCRWL